MKLFQNICIGTVFAADIRSTESKCDVSTLSLPPNGNGWICGASDGGQYVVKGIKCNVSCADGYTEYFSKFCLRIE